MPECHICGLEVPKEDGFYCSDCGEFTCNSCGNGNLCDEYRKILVDMGLALEKFEEVSTNTLKKSYLKIRFTLQACALKSLSFFAISSKISLVYIK